MAGLLELALFIGPNAATWDWENYTKAEQMKLNGAPLSEITAKTGIWWGPDGKPRIEIDDSKARVTGESGTLGKAIEHNSLYNAYPALKELPTDVQKAGMFDPSIGGYYSSQPEKIAVNADEDKILDALLHEIQHAIQQREGFAQGGIPQGMSLKDIQTDPSANAAYQRIMGEAEARAVSARKNMTADKRRSVSPALSYDVPLNSLTWK